MIGPHYQQCDVDICQMGSDFLPGIIADTT